jgi:hypothetical protein
MQYLKSGPVQAYTQSEVDGLLAAGLATKQNTLVSGTDIKTINSLSLLGAGNIAVSGNKAVVDGGSGAGTTINATKDNLYLMYAGNNLNLPATPSIGDEVAFLKTGVINFSVLRNGSNIMGLAENLLVDWNDLPVTLKYLNSSIGWRLM